ncbi:hypothetical protein DASC09_039480 [Saccharomycopsis crataegensis]|uniref:Uncharacterized protein n=1 Tax=Saccharomycopsis crataegensis TaxID=43959 RepID=A0AAV5QP99_9ASCO|nr:hypothetical protein DASC09_039480 [Saccharomycopsis crataegensis]
MEFKKNYEYLMNGFKPQDSYQLANTEFIELKVTEDTNFYRLEETIEDIRELFEYAEKPIPLDTQIKKKKKKEIKMKFVESIYEMGNNKDLMGKLDDVTTIDHVSRAKTSKRENKTFKLT